MAGLGNPLMGDDGIGHVVVERLRAKRLPIGLRAAEVGSDISRLPEIWRREPSIWLVDAIDVQRPPGAVLRFSHDRLLSLPDRHSSVHLLSVSESLRWLLHGLPELNGVQFTLWGVVPESITQRPTLSITADRAVDNLVGEILCAWNTTCRRP